MTDPQASLIIPTRDRWANLVRTLDALSRQTALGQFEVIVADDGSDEAPPDEVAAGQWPMPVKLLRLDHGGIGPAKNRALGAAGGQLLIFINDDTYPQPDFVGQHLSAWQQSTGRKLMHLGLTRWRQWQDQNLFDCLLAESGMIFFYHNLEPRRFYNFRHAWNCNLSVDAAAVREAGGFNERLGKFFFEDLELAYRLEQRGWRVRYWPEAVVTHDHRYSPQGYLARERLLGRMSVWLWRANPECFLAIYQTELDQRYIDRCRRLVAEQTQAISGFARQFEQWHRRSAGELDHCPDRRQAAVEQLVQAHRTLKRYTFDQGLLEEIAKHAPATG